MWQRYSKLSSWFMMVVILLLSSGGHVLAQEPELEEGPIPPREPYFQKYISVSPTEINASVVIFPDADTYIASNRPSENFGDSDGMLLGHSIGSENYGTERLLLHFDLAELIPAGATINSARLVLYLNASTPSWDKAMNVILRRVASEWDENVVTWSREPIWGGVRSEASVISSAGEYEWQITSLVNDWVQGNEPNYGVELLVEENVLQRERIFYARESQSALEPKLIVDFTTEEPDTTVPRATIEPLPEFSESAFTVSWRGTDHNEAGIAYYDIDFRLNGGPWTRWLSQTNTTATTFIGENGQFYEFRARAVDEVGNVERFGETQAQTTVDEQPPFAFLNPLASKSTQRVFTISWTGNDGARGAGIQCYDLQYRINFGEWLVGASCTTSTSAQFTAPYDGFYEFEVRAIDNLNHLEPFTNQAESQIYIDASPGAVNNRQ